MLTLSNSSRWTLDEIVSRVSRALMLAGTLLTASTAGAASISSSLESKSLTTSAWTSAASGGVPSSEQLPPSAFRLAHAELHRASSVLRAIGGDVSAPVVAYLDSLVVLLRPYEEATGFSPHDLSRITVGLEEAWTELVEESTGTSLLVALAEIEPTLLERLAPVDRLARHPVSPTVRGREHLDILLRENPALVGLISEALTVAHDVFEERAEYRLEPFVDPESHTGTTRAYLLVQTKLSFAEAHLLMEQLDDGWWLDNSHRVNGLLSLALDYV